MTVGNQVIGDLVEALFPKFARLQPPPSTEIVELLDAPDVEAWAVEHERTCDGHACENLGFRYRDETMAAVYCPRCELLMVAQDPDLAVTDDLPPEPTHTETAVFVLRANLGVGLILGLMTWLTSLGFTTPGLAFLIAVGTLAVYAGVGRER